ncbi:MAG: YbgC/FadM family acyl-CoA thioesterase [Candidatus Gygaella obscura]|nr:YbgC/FadM family acyl-CoA thioesterase [Candidatus Gygaella obscura]
MDKFFIEKKIYYHDTDCGKVVYYANYLKYLEEARTEFFLKRGIELKRLAEKGILFVVAKVDIDYKAAARYQDSLRVYCEVTSVKRVAIEFTNTIKRDSTIIAQARIVLVCVGNDFKPRSIPEDIKKLLLS